MPKFFITTPIYYVNDVPHIGHAYTTLAADVAARYRRALGDEVFFLTGTDEHGLKIAEAAARQGKSPKEFTDDIAEAFKRAWADLDIDYDHFIRTTDDYHERGVERFMERWWQTGDLYKGRYEGLYCIGCEQFYTADELVDGLCPNHRTPPIHYAEDNYFFKLSQYRDRLIRAIEDPSDPDHYVVDPPSRRNEILGKLRVGLEDISISRNLKWGVPLPWDPEQTAYVWIDALQNYITGVGFGADEAKFHHWWPADVHLLAKDILWFHAVIWPAMLLSVGLRPPRRVFAHGFFTVNGQKLSKSLGNAIPPARLIEQYGVDGTRYLLLAQFPFGVDGDVSEAQMAQRYNADLANDLGNLLNRTVSMVNRYFAGEVPAPTGPAAEVDHDLRATAERTIADLDTALRALDFTGAVAAIGALVTRANRYVDETQPWALRRANDPRLANALSNLVEALRIVAHAVWPFMPTTGERIAAQLGTELGFGRWAEATGWGGYPAGGRVTGQPEPLFPKRELADSGVGTRESAGG